MKNIRVVAAVSLDPVLFPLSQWSTDDLCWCGLKLGMRFQNTFCLHPWEEIVYFPLHLLVFLVHL